MEHHRLRKYRGPEVWARVRVAYEAGESGPSVARRFDVGLANLRKKCRREGWSRRHQAERLDRELAGERRRPDTPPGARGAEPDADAPIDRRAALTACLDHAARFMARGDGARAIAALKAAEVFDAVTQALNLNDPNDPWSGQPDPDGTRAGALRALEALRRQAEIDAAADVLARRMLSERVDDGRGLDAIYHWRAENLGPEVAARDHADAVERGHAGHYFEADGRLKPRDTIVFGEHGQPYRKRLEPPGADASYDD